MNTTFSLILLWLSGFFGGIWVARKALGKSLGDVWDGIAGPRP